MKWFHVQFDEIRAYEVIKVTEKQIVYHNPYWKKPERRTRDNEWYPTFEEAKRYLITRYQNRILSLNHQINETRQRIERASAMTGPANE